MKRLVLVALVLMVAMPFVAHAQKQVYKWTDERGNINYSEFPPPNVDAELVTIQGSLSTRRPEAGGAERDNVDTETQRQVQQARRQTCERARETLVKLESTPQVFVLENEERRLLSPEEREARIAAERAVVRDYCADQGSGS